MKRLALLCVFIIVVGIVPAFAADIGSNNQSKSPQLVNFKNQIKDNLEKIKSLFAKNKDLRSQIKELKKNNLTQDIASLKNQIKSNRAEIKSFLKNNKDLRKERRDIRKNGTS